MLEDRKMIYLSLAQTHKWFTSKDKTTTRGTEPNPNVGGLLGVSDCSQVTDGAAVVVLCSEKYLKEKGYAEKPIVETHDCFSSSEFAAISAYGMVSVNPEKNVKLLRMA